MVKIFIFFIEHFARIELEKFSDGSAIYGEIVFSSLLKYILYSTGVLMVRDSDI